MSEALQAYCVKCKTKRTIANPEATFTTNGTPGTKGTCPVCGTTLFRMGSTEAHAGLSKPEAVPKKSAARTKARTATARAKSARKRTSKSAATAKKTAATKTASSALPRSVNKLVIVESPAKARSVGQYLGRGYVVKASKGHIRDLLVSQLSVDVENEFEPKYRVMNDKRDVVKELKSAIEHANEVFLATDPDREGEAIAWHLIHATEIDGQPINVKRVVFHEITKPAVQEAFTHPREIDMNLVNAQQARRILDRLVGYNITQLLWEKVRNRLSAGRVQSIACRLIVDREREIEHFVPIEYWTLDARLRKQQGSKDDRKPFLARLVKIGAEDVNFGKEGDVSQHLDTLKKSQYVVVDIKRGERQRKPSPPFTTSTLQQEASRRLHFTASRTMMIAQQLYEGINIPGEGSIGMITYMRTDSLNVSSSAQHEARHWVTERFGSAYLPPKPPIYRTKAKGAQEAHEAIRPTAVMRTPESIRKSLTNDQFKLYNLIWQRFVSSQMATALYNTLRVDIDAGLTEADKPYHFRVNGSTLKFAGFLALYEDTRDEDVAVDEDDGRILPEMQIGEHLDLMLLLPEQHFTQPPPRYTEASIVRTLEELGIGRPSTYAPIVSVIQDREYVEKKQGRLTPTETGRIVNDLLVSYFPDVMDYQFTARMEEQLDEVSEGSVEWRPMLGDFYAPFETRLRYAKETITPIEQVEYIGRECPLCGKPLVIRYGRFGKFIGCSDYPTCRHTEPWLDRMGIECPVCGKDHHGEITRRQTRRGRTFYGCSRYPDCDFTSWKKPLPQPCPHCGGLLVENNRATAQCTNCDKTVRIASLPHVDTEAV